MFKTLLRGIKFILKGELLMLAILLGLSVIVYVISSVF